MSVKTFRQKPVEIQAVQFIAGTSTKTEMLKFCPTANIGVPENDETDIRWFVIPGTIVDLDVIDRDWIIKRANGRFSVQDPELFAATYEEVKA
jgi:hypothetical protein